MDQRPRLPAKREPGASRIGFRARPGTPGAKDPAYFGSEHSARQVARFCARVSLSFAKPLIAPAAASCR